MENKNLIKFEGTVVEVLKNGCKAKLPNGHIVTVVTSGEFVIGDNVTIEVSLDNLTKGKITKA